VLRQEYRAGEKLFVDYAGATIPIYNVESGEVWEAAIFVAVLGASNYTYAEASLTQGLADWIRRPYARLRVPGRRARNRHPGQSQVGGHESVPV